MKDINYYFEAINSRIKKKIFEYKGWKTDRKIVVIESDDWGSLRLPSKITREFLRKNGVKLDFKLGYDYCDSIATESDLENLMEILSTVKDINGNSAKITLNCVVANPNFEKILNYNYEEFHYELITETFKRFKETENVFDLWKEGINKGLLHPQFHGREHLNVQMWLNSLQNNFGETRLAFGQHVFFPKVSSEYDRRESHLRAFDVKNSTEYSFVKNSIEDGLRIFEDLFGFSSSSFIAPNYTWDDEINPLLSRLGVKYFQGSYFQRYSSYKERILNKKGCYHYLGEINKEKQLFLIRNCYWEPSQNKKLNYDYSLKCIEKAFKLKQPAIISAHRLNFIGAIEHSNRIRNLKDFNLLLHNIVNKWPDVEFLTSDELGDIMRKDIIPYG